MKKNVKRVLSVILTIALLLTSVPLAFAAGSNEPLTVDVTMTKDEYVKYEPAEITVTVTNTSEENVNRVSAEAVFTQLAPCGKNGELTKEVETLTPGESFYFTYKAMMNQKEYSIKWYEKIAVWFIRVLHGCRKTSDNGFNDGRECITDVSSVKFGNFNTENTVKVWYEKQPETDNSNPVTKGEWILKLSETLKWNEQFKDVPIEGNSKFVDIAGAECEQAIIYASCLGLFDETAGNFYPDSPATREFVAVTSVRALQFTDTQDIDCADSSSIQHPKEVFTAVSLELFALENNSFNPNKNLTLKESEKIINKILEINGSTENTKNHEEIVYTDNFVKLSDTIKYTKNENTFYFETSSETKQLQKNNIFFVENEYFKIKSVTEENGKLVVVTEEPAMNEVFESINVGGSQELTVVDFEPAEGVEIINQPQTMRAARGGEIDIAELSLKIDKEIAKDVKLYGKIDIDNPRLDYNADIDFTHHVIPVFKDVHLKTTFDLKTDVGISAKGDSPHTIKDGSFTLGRFPVYGIAGIGVYIDVSINFYVTGKVKVTFESTAEAGFQIYNNLPRNIASISSPKYNFTELEANSKIGPKVSGLLELSKNWKLIDFSLFGGVAAKGSLDIRNTGLVCLSANLYLFVDFEAMQESIINNWIDVKATWNIWDENNSPKKSDAHFENFEYVPKCTYKEIKFAGGDGTSENPYLVATPEQLNAVRFHLDKYFLQIKDIDMSKWGNWEPIGTEESPFIGSYNGGEKNISNLSISQNIPQDGTGEALYTGLFGLCVNTTLTNIKLHDIAFKSINSAFIGGIAGGLKGDKNSLIDNCTVSGYILINAGDRVSADIGGIVGVIIEKFDTNYKYHLPIKNCSNYATIDASKHNLESSYERGFIIGGITGRGGKIINCDNYGNITATANGGVLIGGISGTTTECINCFNSGNLKGELKDNNYSKSSSSSVGGIIGSRRMLTYFNIENCVNMGAVSAKADGYTNIDFSYAGGITASYYENSDNSDYLLTIKNCYNLSKEIKSTQADENGNIVNAPANEIAPKDMAVNVLDCYTSSSTSVNGGGTTGTIPMLEQNEFLKEETYKGFDFENTWRIDPEIGCAVLR